MNERVSWRETLHMFAYFITTACKLHFAIILPITHCACLLKMISLQQQIGYRPFDSLTGASQIHLKNIMQPYLILFITHPTTLLKDIRHLPLGEWWANWKLLLLPAAYHFHFMYMYMYMYVQFNSKACANNRVKFCKLISLHLFIETETFHKDSPHSAALIVGIIQWYNCLEMRSQLSSCAPPTLPHDTRCSHLSFWWTPTMIVSWHMMRLHIWPTLVTTTNNILSASASYDLEPSNTTIAHLTS